MRWSLASRSARPSTPVSCQRVSHVGAVSGMSFCQKPGRAGAVREPLEVERPVGEVGQHRRRDPREVADELALGDRRRRALARAGSKSGLVEVGQLELVGPDLPDAFLAERVEGGELGVGDAPGAGMSSARSASAFDACVGRFGRLRSRFVPSVGLRHAVIIVGRRVSRALPPRRHGPRWSLRPRSRAGRSSGRGPARGPCSAAWRTTPSRVQPPSSARITSSGRTQVTAPRSPPQRPL